jgi:precorrin-3B methylase
MISPSTLTEKDTGRRVIWEIAPGVEEMAQLGAWLGDVLVIFVAVSGSKYLRPVEVFASQVRWAEEIVRRAS